MNPKVNTLKLRGIQIKFFVVDQNSEKSLKCILTKFKLSVSYRFQGLQFKINNFSLTSVLPFLQYCDRTLTFGKLAYITLKAANLQL